MERPLLVPLASLITGILAAHLLDVIPPAWALAPLLVTTLAACFVRASFPFLLSLSVLFMVWGAASLEPFLRPAAALPGFAGAKPVRIEGVVCRRPEGSLSGGAKVYVDVERVSTPEGESAVTGRLLVYVREGRPALATGDRIIFSSRIRAPRRYGIPGEADHPRALAYQGVFATGFVMEPRDLVLLRAGSGWLHGQDLLAEELGRFIMRSERGGEGGVLKALLLGDRSDVSQQLQEAYARGGVNHILSISGFHVGIVFLSLFHALYLAARCFEPLALRLNLKQAMLAAALPVVVFYLFLSGHAPATVRSVLMIAALVVALHLKREVDPVNSLMFAAICMLLATPQTFFELSFQLSFLAIWGLVVSAPPSAAFCGGAGKVARWLLLMLAASAAAVAATLVPVAYYFQRVSLVGLVANLVVVPLMGYGAVVLGLTALPLSYVAEPFAQWLLHLAATLVRLSDRAVGWLAQAPVLDGYVPDRIDLLLASLVLCSLTFFRARTHRAVAAVPLLVVLLLRGIPVQGGGDGVLTLYFLSVGQGDATLVHLPDGKWMMVDGGGNAADVAARVGPRLLVPALRHLGVRRLEYLALSHEHPDHLQGVLHLAAWFDVGEFWESGIGGNSLEYRQLKWVLAARGVPVRVLHPGAAPVPVGGAFVQVLWPEAGQAGSLGPNEDSLVFRLRHGKGSVLFTGDIGMEVEAELVTRGAVQDCSILKVAHHGSRYSTGASFLHAASPRVAVISAGYGNIFGLPAPSTVARLQRHGIRIYRTDMDGTVQARLGIDGSPVVSTPWGHFN